VNYHAGNEHFRALVRKHKVAYVACPKPQKGKFSKMIVDEIKSRNPPGRFLKQDASTKLWYDIGEKKALDKTRQALREGAPEIMKELHGDEDDESNSDEHNSSPVSPIRSTVQPVSERHLRKAHGSSFTLCSLYYAYACILLPFRWGCKSQQALEGWEASLKNLLLSHMETLLAEIRCRLLVCHRLIHHRASLLI